MRYDDASGETWQFHLGLRREEGKEDPGSLCGLCEKHSDLNLFVVPKQLL